MLEILKKGDYTFEELLEITGLPEEELKEALQGYDKIREFFTTLPECDQ